MSWWSGPPSFISSGPPSPYTATLLDSPGGPNSTTQHFFTSALPPSTDHSRRMSEESDWSRKSSLRTSSTSSYVRKSSTDEMPCGRYTSDQERQRLMKVQNVCHWMNSHQEMGVALSSPQTTPTTPATPLAQTTPSTAVGDRGTAGPGSPMEVVTPTPLPGDLMGRR